MSNMNILSKKSNGVFITNKTDGRMDEMKGPEPFFETCVSIQLFFSSFIQIY